MVDVAELGLKVVTDQAGDARLVLDDLTAAAGRAEDAAQDLTAVTGKLNSSVGKVGAATGKAAQGMGKVGAASILASGNTRMLTMQLSQVAQQASATGNVTQALAIQAADIGLAFGTVGTVVGILATIALPTLVNALTGVEGKGRSVTDILEDMDAAVALSIKSIEAARAPVADLTAKYGRLADEAKRALDAIAETDQLAALNEIGEAIAAVTASGLDLFAGIEQQSIAGRIAMDNVKRELGLTSQGVHDLKRAFDDLRNAEGLAAQAQAGERLLAEIDKARDSAGRLPPALQAIYKHVADIIPKAAEANTKFSQMEGFLDAAERAARGAASAVGGIGTAADGALGAVKTLAGAMWDLAHAQRAAEQGRQAGSMVYGQVGARGDPRTSNTQGYGEFNRPTIDDYIELYSGKGAGGGGGGGAAGNPRLDSLVQELQTEREILEQWYDESLAILEAANEAELAAIGGRNEAKLRMEQEYQDRMRGIVEAERSVRMGEYADMFEGLASIAGAGGKKMLKAQATLSAAATLISAYETAMKAASEAVTLPGRIAAYAKFLGMGLSAVAQIRKAGGIGGGTTASTASTPAVQQASPVNVSIQGINPTSLYSGQQVIDLTTAVQKEFKNRGVIFSYV